jgi:hypothetical protein
MFVAPHQGARFVSNALEERGRALEDEFFYKENKAKIAALKEQQELKDSKEALRKASGMTDEAVLDHLVALGLRANTISALSLVPLVAVAWADGEVQDHERDAIMQGAHGKGLDEGSPAYLLLEGWLAKRPADSLLETWESYIKALGVQLNDEQNRLLKNQILGFAKIVASADGGILGIGKVSAKEEAVLLRLEAAFAR